MRLTEIMALANGLAGCADTPPDSQVYLDGEVRRVFVGIDVDVAELLLARALGVDGVIAHHPIGSQARLGITRVIERHEAQVVPNERALRVEIRGLPEGGFRKIQLAHFIVSES